MLKKIWVYLISILIKKCITTKMSFTTYGKVTFKTEMVIEFMLKNSLFYIKT